MFLRAVEQLDPRIGAECKASLTETWEISNLRNLKSNNRHAIYYHQLSLSTFNSYWKLRFETTWKIQISKTLDHHARWRLNIAAGCEYHFVMGAPVTLPQVCHRTAPAVSLLILYFVPRGPLHPRYTKKTSDVHTLRGRNYGFTPHLLYKLIPRENNAFSISQIKQLDSTTLIYFLPPTAINNASILPGKRVHRSVWYPANSQKKGL